MSFAINTHFNSNLRIRALLSRVLNRMPASEQSSNATAKQNSNAMTNAKQIEGLSKNSNIGYFGALPQEVIGVVLSYLSNRELSVVSITNKGLRDLIFDLVLKTTSGFKRIVSKTRIFTHEDDDCILMDNRLKAFEELGLSAVNMFVCLNVS